MKIKFVFTFIITLSMISVGHAQLPSKAKLDQFLDQLDEKKKAMGSLLIAKDGKILYARSIGYSQIDGTEKKLLSAQTKYRIGSITKVFTATMIFQLIEERKLKLTDTLYKFLPQVPNAKKITIEQILAHRSGIHEVSNDQDYRALRTKGLAQDEMMALIVKSAPDFEPGQKYAYSNTGYFVLGTLVEKLTGKSYSESLKKRITDRIGIKDTYPASGNIDISKNESFSYKYSRDWEKQIETHPSLLFGSGSIVSTAADMASFIQALFNVKLVSKTSLDQMTNSKLGLDTFTYNGKIAYGHTGGVDGFGAWLAYVPAEKLTVSYATNGKVYPVADMIDNVFNIYWGKEVAIPTFQSLVISTEVLDKYVGVYANPAAPLKFTVTRDGQKLFLQLTGQSLIPLEPTAIDKFKVETPPLTIEFDVDKKQLIIKRNGGERVFTKEN